jgi:8-oxo-dGTP diphosphatase
MISNPRYCPQCGTALEMRLDGDRLRPVCPACGFIFYLNPLVAAGTLVEHDGKVALVKRGVDPGRGLWGLPAGYVEADESAEEAAVRETFEEAHLVVEVDGLLDAFSYRSDQNRGVLLVYAARVLSGDLVAGDDAMDAGWFAPDELPEIAFRTHREVLHKWRQARAIVYRPATVAEAEVAKMLAEAYPFGEIDEYMTLVSHPDKELFVALDDEQVVGFAGVALFERTSTAQIDHVFVHPRYRRWGIGTRLIQACVEFGRQRGSRAILVQVPVTNSGWTVYLNAGFRMSGFSNDYYASRAQEPQPALLLTYDLS